MPTQATEQQTSLRIDNVGGIEAAEVDLQPGVTVLTGRNATNRTSLLQAVMGALGSHDVSLRAGAEAGQVTLELDGETFERRLVRTDDGVTLDGSPYLSDPTVADLFAFLLRSNPARQAIVQQGDLREVILEPIDTEAIQTEIERLEARRRELDRELEDLDADEARLPQLEQERDDLEAEIEETRAALEEVEATIDDQSHAASPDKTVPDPLDRLREARRDLQDVRRRIETERESIDALRQDRADVEADLESLEGDGEVDPAELDREIEVLRERREQLRSSTAQLREIYQFNAEALETDDHPLGSPATADEGASNPTDRLVSEDRLECWTCGNSAPREAFESTQDRLQELIEEHREERAETEDRLEQLTDRRESLEATRRERRSLRDRLDTIENELEDRQNRLEALEEDRADLERTVEELEAEAADLSGIEDRLDRHREAHQLEYDLERLQAERDEVVDEIRSIEADLEQRAALESEWEEVQSALLDERSKVERIETQAVEAFNDQMESVLDRLDYANVARIWIERVAADEGPGAARFELNIVRETDGVMHRDRIEHLSESEREVTGLVFALAGYLVHDVHETVPFVLLDSLEAIDADRIARLVEHFAEHARYLVVALLPEDAAALDADYHRITEI